MNEIQQLSKLLNKVDNMASQCRSDGDVNLARTYEQEAVCIAKQIAELSKEKAKKAMAK